MKANLVWIYDRFQHGKCPAHRMIQIKLDIDIFIPYLYIRPDFKHIEWVCAAWGIKWPLAVARKLYVKDISRMIYDRDPCPF